MLCCFKFKEKGSNDTGRTTPNSSDLPEPWIRYYDEEGAQLFYNRKTQLITYLNPITLKEVQTASKTGRGAVIEMHAKTGEPYGVDYTDVPNGRVVYMPLELRKNWDHEKRKEKTAQ